MSVTLIQAIQLKLQESFGTEVKISEEAVRLSLQMGHLLSQGKICLKEILNVSDEHIEVLYAVAYEAYQKNKLEDASKIFALLCSYDPMCVKFWEGLGATQKLLNNHNEALIAYFTLTQIRPLKISYYLDLAEEFFKIKQIDSAIKCCEAIEFMANDETFKPENKDAEACLKKASLLRRALEKNDKE